MRRKAIEDQKPVENIVAVRARRRIIRRLMPYLFVLFVIAYLDRVDVGYAALQMKGDLSFTDEVLGFGAGVFFWGYVLLEIPGTILVEKWSARRWIARIMISWGIVAMLMGFVQTKNQFYLLRFLLGVHHGTHGGAQSAVEHVAQQEIKGKEYEQIKVENALQ